MSIYLIEIQVILNYCRQMAMFVKFEKKKKKKKKEVNIKATPNTKFYSLEETVECNRLNESISLTYREPKI